VALRRARGGPDFAFEGIVAGLDLFGEKRGCATGSTARKTALTKVWGWYRQRSCCFVPAQGAGLTADFRILSNLAELTSLVTGIWHLRRG